MFTIRCCKCGKVHYLNNIDNLCNGLTNTKQGTLTGMTTKRYVNGKLYDYFDKKHLLVCCEKCYKEWRIFFIMKIMIGMTVFLMYG